jgi:hypothetical protein
LEAFDKAFQEAFAKGMAKADWRAQVLWLPKAIFYNPPASPNVVKGWVGELEFIPPCDLKNEAIESIKFFLSGLGESFENAFKPSRKPLPKPSAKPSRKPSPNQEQEQEQELRERASAYEDEPIVDSDLKVRLIWETYPTASSIPRQGEIPPGESEVIIEAIIRDGYDPVLVGTRNYRDAVERWPPGEKRFIRPMRRFFTGSDPDYNKPPEFWERGKGNGNGKSGYDSRTRAQRDQDATVDAVAEAKRIVRGLADRAVGNSGDQQGCSANSATAGS